MVRRKSYKRDELVEKAMTRFWVHGYFDSSIDDLVRETGVSRHGLYAEFGGKRGLFLSCLDAYQDHVVTPAFAHVEREGAGLAAIGAYFETQIARAETVGLPGPGCLVANTSTELAPHDGDISASVSAHFDRLRDGFQQALATEFPGLRSDRAADLAGVLTVSAQGLWSLSRTVDDAATLRTLAETLLDMVKREAKA